eukprot:426462-Prymnesium_polylepis.1
MGQHGAAWGSMGHRHKHGHGHGHEHGHEHGHIKHHGDAPPLRSGARRAGNCLTCTVGSPAEGVSAASITAGSVMTP